MVKTILSFMIVAVSALSIPLWAATTELQVNSGDVKLWVSSAGESDNVLLLISGGPGASSDYMASLQTLAGPNLRVVRMDLRGTGKSSAPSNQTDYLPSDYVNDLEAVRKALGVEKMALLGHSYGGLTAMNYAVAHPTHVAALVLYGSSPTTKKVADPTDKGYAVRQEALIATGVLQADAPEGSYEYFRLFFAPYFYDPNFTLSPELLSTTISDVAAQGTLAAFGNYDIHAAVQSIKVPTLLMTGEADPYELGVGATIRTLEKDLANSHPEVFLIPRCGHLWQECSEAALSKISNFLKAHVLQLDCPTLLKGK